jgi:acyl homoserine lactone synthase
MIDCITLETSHLFGSALASQHRLRHRVFVERQQWNIPSYRGMEYDQYDTPAAHYLVWRDDDGEVRGVSRLSPTSRPYMLAEQWPDMVTKVELPDSDLIWEGTRFGIDRDLEPALRKRVLGELVVAYLEFSLRNGIRRIVGVMPTLIWRAVFVNSGWPVEFMGEVRRLGPDKVAAGAMEVSPEVLARVRAKTGIHHPVLRTADDLLVQAQVA